MDGADIKEKVWGVAQPEPHQEDLEEAEKGLPPCALEVDVHQGPLLLAKGEGVRGLNRTGRQLACAALVRK